MADDKQQIKCAQLYGMVRDALQGDYIHCSNLAQLIEVRYPDPHGDAESELMHFAVKPRLKMRAALSYEGLEAIYAHENSAGLTKVNKS